MDRILVFGMTENPGGVESFLMNYYRNIDRDRLQFDFLCNSHRPVAYEDELKSLGAKTYHVAARSEDFGRYRRELDAFFQETKGRYRAIWVNVSSLANIDYLKYAKKYGIPRRIIHSHNSRNMDSALRGMVHRLNRLTVGWYATDFWACSGDAADWFYGGRLRGKAVLVRNAISVETFAFSEEKRQAVREGLKWPDGFLIGNIGRLHFQKNQKFILQIFAALQKEMPDCRLVLVGAGEDEQMLKTAAKDLKIADSVCFAGVQRDIPAYLSAFDLFLFPSLFEGLSVAALEAQASGIPVLASEGVIPQELRINENFWTMSLQESAAEWAKRVREIRENRGGRIPSAQVKENFQRCGYEIGTEAARMQRELLR